MQARTAEEVVQLTRDEGVEIVDIRFCDLPGLMQHFSVPAHELTEAVFVEGLGFDGSSIRGFQEIQESDMILIPDPSTAVLDPFRQHKTLNLNCFVHDPVTLESYSRDPRYVALKAERYLQTTGIADTVYFGPEAEFFIFDDVRFSQDQRSAFYQVDSIEGIWNSGRDEKPNLGFKPRYKEGYFPVPPMDHFQDLRSEMILTMERLGIEIEVQHHEVASGGQAEIDMRFDTLLAHGRQADALQVRGEERRPQRRVLGHLHAQAPVPGQRVGDALPPVAVDAPVSRSFTPRPATRACPTSVAGTSAACSSTPRPCSRSPLRRRTPTSGWYLATRPR